ncbi:MAG: glycoside hydrolase family 3 C-terminal domain-containing protein [Ilumatobacteraceae bacterium]
MTDPTSALSAPLAASGPTESTAAVDSVRPEAAEAAVEALLDRASLAQLVALLSGVDFWHTAAVPELGIPQMRVSDGPAGARGTRFDGEASINVPCSTLLAATWDPATIELVGHLLGRETKAKGASVLLAPTVNIHRTPIGGRNFECMSEDPYLTARTAVAYVQGLQAEGVASCIKHFVGNDTEFERMSIDSRIDERTLREVYLVPFEAAVKEAGVQSIMTSYNRINGEFAGDSPLIEDVLRGEWGFDGAVISDWFGLHSTGGAINAGVDLEMPGPGLVRGQLLLDAVANGEVAESVLRERARQVLRLMQRVGALDAEGPGPEGTRHDVDDLALVRRVAAEGMVLLLNAPVGAGEPALPLATGALRRIAVVGPNAAVGQLMGGGSAHVTPTSVSHPLDALQQRLAPLGIEVVHEPGCLIHRALPAFDLRRCSTVEIDYFETAAEMDDPAATPVLTGGSGTLHLMWVSDPLGRNHADPDFGARIRTTFTPDASGVWQFGVASIMPARLLIDGEVVLDNTDVEKGGSFFGMGRGEKVIEVALEAGREYAFVAELRHGSYGATMSGILLGSAAPVRPGMFEAAVDLAASADLTIVVVGTNDEWESEGWDRDTLSLPGRQDELVAAVAAASPATVVVVNSGSPITMPWLHDVHAVLMSWFPGQEMGEAIADVLLGEVEPQGRLPVSFPARLEDTPAFEHDPGRNGVANYLEGRLLGYRWYDTVGREPLFPFGFGLGYTPAVITSAVAPDAHTVEVQLHNPGGRDAVEVVQVYAHRVGYERAPGDEPEQWLVGFVKVPVPAGGDVAATVTIDANAYRRWDVDAHAWAFLTEPFELRVGHSSRDIAVRLTVHP